MTEQPPAGGLPPGHLDEVFTPPRRSAKLSMILPAAPPPAAPSTPAEDAGGAAATVPGADAQAAAATKDEATSGTVAPAAEPEKHRASATSTGGRRLIIVYMPASQRDWLRRAAVGSTQLDVVLDAVEQAELAGELGKAVSDAYQPETGGLFVRQRSGRGGRAHVQVSLSALESHVEVLDRLVTQHGAPDRSALVRAALDHARTHSRKHP